MSSAAPGLYRLSVHRRIDFDPRLLLLLSIAIPVACALSGLWFGVVLGLIPVFVLSIAWTVRRDTWLKLDRDGLVLHMGWIFHHHLPLSEIDSAAPAEHRYLSGLGARRLAPGVLGVILDTSNVVQISLRREITFRVFPALRIKARSVRTNPIDPERFLTELDRLLEDQRSGTSSSGSASAPVEGAR